MTVAELEGYRQDLHDEALDNAVNQALISGRGAVKISFVPNADMTDPAIAASHGVNKDEQNRRGRIRTATRKLINPWTITPDQVDINDIAIHLSNETRYGGAVGFYSVGQHSIIVSEYFDDPTFIIAGLLHDAEEAFFKDMPSPVKANDGMATYREGAERCRRVIFEAFGLGKRYDELMQKVHVIDEMVYFRERRSFDGMYVRHRIVPMAPGMSTRPFLQIFNRWIGEIS